MKIEFSGLFVYKNSTNQFHENPSSGSRVIPRGEEDGQIWRT
jgi:hypothetical protein